MVIISYGNFLINWLAWKNIHIYVYIPESKEGLGVHHEHRLHQEESRRWGQFLSIWLVRRWIAVQHVTYHRADLQNRQVKDQRRVPDFFKSCIHTGKGLGEKKHLQQQSFSYALRTTRNHLNHHWMGINSSITISTWCLETPVIWLRKWGFLVSKQPAMTISGVDYIDITPLQRTRW